MPRNRHYPGTELVGLKSGIGTAPKGGGMPNPTGHTAFRVEVPGLGFKDARCDPPKLRLHDPRDGESSRAGGIGRQTVVGYSDAFS